MKFERLNLNGRQTDRPVIAVPTAKLIEDRPFEPVPTVTEDSTDLLLTPEKRRRS
jgi:hypothetical protein